MDEQTMVDFASAFVQNVLQSALYAAPSATPAARRRRFHGMGVQHVQSGAINETHIFSPR